MTPSAAAWLDGLRTFAAVGRAAKPLAPVSPPELTAWRMILAAHLALWIEGEASGYPDTHAIVLTTSDTGIVVSEEVFGDAEPLRVSLRPRIVAVREIEYRLWTKTHPDPDHVLHVNHWSWIKAPVPRQRWQEFHEFPIAEGDAYWLHRTGTAGLGPIENRTAHLWRWTGAQAVLLKPFFRERVDAL